MDDTTNNVPLYIPHYFSTTICRTLVTLAALVALFGSGGNTDHVGDRDLYGFSGVGSAEAKTVRQC
jgi:hypothetical protein